MPRTLHIDEHVINFLKKLKVAAKPKGQPQPSIEFAFFFWVMFCALLLISFVSYPTVVPYLYCIPAPLVITARVFLYRSLKWDYYLLDFCYFGNALFIFFLVFGPKFPGLFQVVFVVNSGPLLWGALMWRNSMVFHSMDKMTSIFIHLLPSLVTHLIRWDPDVAAVWQRPSLSKSVVNVEGQASSLLLLVVAPILFFFCHQCFYHILIYEVLKPNEEYDTLYRLVYAMDRRSWQYKLMYKFGPRHCVFMYNIVTLAFATLGVMVAQLLYHYKLICVAVHIASVVILVWRGGTYYSHVFDKYQVLKEQ